MRERPKVLVAEDEPLIASLLEILLQEQGYDPHSACDGEAALGMAERTRFDVLLTDLHMPRMGGAQLIRSLRAKRPALPVVVISGNAPVDWPSQLHRDGEGPLVLLRKPLDLPRIPSALQDVLVPIS